MTSLVPHPQKRSILVARTASIQREVEPDDDIHVRLLVDNDTTSRLLVRIASLVSALIEYKYSRIRTI